MVRCYPQDYLQLLIARSRNNISRFTHFPTRIPPTSSPLRRRPNVSSPPAGRPQSAFTPLPHPTSLSSRPWKAFTRSASTTSLQRRTPDELPAPGSMARLKYGAREKTESGSKMGRFAVGMPSVSFFTKDARDRMAEPEYKLTLHRSGEAWRYLGNRSQRKRKLPCQQ